jgi:hypothetical protein
MSKRKISRLFPSRSGLRAAAGVLLTSLAVLLWLAPADQHLGEVVKLVYLHGALVRAGMLTFFAAGAVGLVATVAWLLGQARFARLSRWAWLLVASGVITWVVYSLSSVVVTYITWGVAVAWGEPRVQASVRVLVSSLLLLGVGQLVADPRFRAVIAIILAGLVGALIFSANVIRHPIDPIGGSSSAAIKTFYTLINWAVLGLVGCLVVWLEIRTRPKRAAL